MPDVHPGTAVKPAQRRYGRDALTLEDLCTLTGSDPGAYAGFVALLVPRSWRDPDAAKVPMTMSSDAPSAAAIISVLGAAVKYLGDQLQSAGEAAWDPDPGP